MAKYNIIEKKEKTPLYRSLMNPDIVNDLYEKILCKFVVEKKYRDPEYNAQIMAAELGTNARYISAVVNLRYQDNYSQMVNEYRIKEAMYLLNDTHSAKMTMEDIALSVGFANRQSFYAAFFKRTGTSPRKYRADRMKIIDEKLDGRRAQLKASRAKKKQETANGKNAAE